VPAADVKDHGLPVISAVTGSPMITAFFTMAVAALVA
jgi:hypothetical protein